MSDENPFRAPQQESLAPVRWPLCCLVWLVIEVTVMVLLLPIVGPAILVATLLDLFFEWWTGRITSWREARGLVIRPLLLVMVYPVVESYAEVVKSYERR